MAVSLTVEEISKLEEIQDLVNQVVEILYNDALDTGNAFGKLPFPAPDTNFGAYYDQPSPDNLYSVDFYLQSEGYPILESTDFVVLRDWASLLNSQALANPEFYFDLADSGPYTDFILSTASLINSVQEWIDDRDIDVPSDIIAGGGGFSEEVRAEDIFPRIASDSGLSEALSLLEEIVDGFKSASPRRLPGETEYETVSGDIKYEDKYDEGPETLVGVFDPEPDWTTLYRDTDEISRTDSAEIAEKYEVVIELAAELKRVISNATGWSRRQLLGLDPAPTADEAALAAAESGYIPFEGERAGSITAPTIDCRDPEAEEAEPDCPPPCQNDPRAISPNWTRQSENEPFLNSKTCEYSISLRTEYEAAPIEDLFGDPNYLQIGVEKLLDYYGKMMEPYDNEEGERVDPVQLCVDAGTIKETFVSTRPYVKMKALVVVPYDVFNSIEEQGQPEELPDRKEQPAFVTIEGEDFLFMARQVARAMDIMAVRQADWFFNAGGQLSEPTFNPKDEADRIRDFVKEMRNLLAANDFKLRKPFGLAKKWVGEFEIGFNEEMGVDYVKATEKTCEKPEMLIKSIGAFKNSEPQTLPRTMYFVSQLPEMQADFTSANSISFDDFLRKYVAFPPVEVTVQAAGAQSLDPIWCPPPGEDTALTNFDLGEDLRELGKSIMDEVLSFPDAFANRFANDLCATLEGKKKKDVDFNDLGQLARQAADTALREYFAGDPFLNDLPRKLSQMTDIDEIELWDKILDQLGLCGLLSLIEAALDCLLAGLGAEDVLKTMLNSVIGGMSAAAFEVLMLGLPPEAKDQIRANLADEFKNMPAPWDADYRQGSYSGQGTKFTWGENPNAPTGQQGAPITQEVTITNDDGSMSIAEETTTDSEYKWYKPQKEVTTTAGLPTTVGSTTGVVINETAIGQSYGNSGTIGTALDKVADQVGQAYKEALLDLIDNNLIDLDMLKEQLTSIPGAQLFADIFQELDCPPFPLFTPPLGNILTTLELNLCPAHFAISLPRLSLNVSIGDIFKLIISVAKELIKELVIRLIILILKKILEIIFEALCALLELVGSALVDAITGGNALKDALGGALCDDATEEDINEAMRQMLEATGLSNCNGPEEVPTPEDAAAFTEIAASVLTNQEVLDLLDGSATTQVKEMIANVVGDQIPGLSCMSPSDIGTLFNALGKVVNPELIERAQMMENLDAPVCESICASPEQLQRFDEIRCDAMKRKGLSPEQCEEQLAALRDRAREDLADLANILNGGPFHNFPDLIGSDPVCPDSGDPFAPGGSILPDVPKVLNDAATDAAKKVFDAIAEEHIDDLVGSRGFLDMVLSDSNGRGLKAHERAVNGPFGEPLTDDLGFLQSYTDNWMNDDGKNTELDKNFPREAADRGNAGDWGVFGIDHVGNGGFPITVASLLQYYFTAYNEDVTPDLPVKKADTSDGPASSMRDATIDPEGARGIPWTNETFELKYRDYVKQDDESYAMRMAVNLGTSSSEDITAISVYESVEGEDEELVSSYTVKSNVSEEAASVLDSIDLPASPTGFPKKVFSKFIASKLGEYGATNTSDLEDVLENQWEYLCDVYMRKFTLLMASNSEGTTDPLPNSFQYGYATDQQVKQVYMGGEDLDRQFFNDNREYYLKGDGTQATYEEATRPGETENDGPYIQAQILDRFGGKFKNPPWFEKNPERFGWLGMTDRLVPDPDACDPLDGSEPREPICKFEDLKDVYSDLMNKYEDDKRLFMRPNAHCARPQPFNAIFNRGGAAGVDTTIIAMIRIFIIESMLRGTAIFSVYGSECYDEILSSYIIRYMDDELSRLGVWNLPSKRFYHLFMEQVVQSYGRQVDLGMINPTSDEQDALNYLNSYQMENQFIAKGVFAQAVYNNRLGEIIEEALELEATGVWTAGIRTLLSHFVLKEIQNMFEQFGDSVYPDGAPVSNVHSILFNSPAFIRGSIESGIPDVWNGKEGAESNIYEADLVSKPYPTLAGKEEGIGSHPFRLEKYISFEETPDDIEEYLRGVVSIEEFKNWAATQSDKLPQTVSDLFSNGKLGFRLVFASSVSEQGDLEWGGEDNTGDFYSGFETAVSGLDSVALEQKTLKASINQGENTSEPYAVDQTHMYMVPISAAEMDLDLSQTLQQFIDTIDTVVEDNQQCLLDEIARSGEFQVMFDHAIPTRKMLSCLAIYTINNFLPSIGWVQDGWVKDGGKWQGFAGGFRSWDQRSFEKSKREAKRAFMRFYHSGDPTYEDEESKGRKEEITRQKKPKPNNDPGLRWFRWRRKIRKPTDKNGKLCL